MSLGTLPAWGMTRAGELFELPTPERRISAPESSSLPTPVADHSRGLAQPGSDFQSLPNVALSLLPTPAVNDMGAGKDPQAWDEWTERMKEAHGNGNGHGKSLEQEALRMLPTPMTSYSESSVDSWLQRRRAGKGQISDLRVAMQELIGASTGQRSDDGSDSAGQHPSPPSQEPTASSGCLRLSSSG